VRKVMVASIGAVVVAGSVAGGAIAFAGGDTEGGATGRQAERAVHAALEATGGGTAQGVERDGEDGAVWEVEVRKRDGAVVDVRLDATYHVVVIEGDAESHDANDGGS
jgi:hypothetical protein